MSEAGQERVTALDEAAAHHGEHRAPPRAGLPLRRAARVVRLPAVPAMALMAVGLGLGNAVNYAYNIAMSRLLGPASYGALAALLALVLIGSVPGLALQAVVARHSALRAGDRAALAGLWSGVLAATLLFGAALGVAGVAAAPAVGAFLHLGSLGPSLWLAATLVPLPALFAVQGMLQGSERFGALAAVMTLNAAGKLAAGLGMVLLGGGIAAALSGVVAGEALALLAGLAAVRPSLGLGAARRRSAGLAREVWQAGAALLGLLLLTNLDTPLARHYLDAHDAGLYAAGAIMAKIAFWGPQFVGMVVFPRLVTGRDRSGAHGRLAAGAQPVHDVQNVQPGEGEPARQRYLTGALLVVATLGGLLVAATAAAPHLAVLLPFGARYRQVGPLLPLFAALGTMLALAQLVLFSGIAAADRRTGRLPLAAALVEAAAIALVLHHSIVQVAGAAIGTAAALLAAGWLLERRRERVAAAARAQGVAVS